MLTQSELQELLNYNSETGIFYWKNNKKGHVKKGDLAGSNHVKGYITIRIGGKDYLAHRLALIISGVEIPIDRQIDHINGNKKDNRLSNLRLASYNQNNQNVGIRRDNLSGFKGVGFESKRNKWRARIRSNNKIKWLGYFDTPEEAHEAYCREAEKLHGPFART